MIHANCPGDICLGLGRVAGLISSATADPAVARFDGSLAHGHYLSSPRTASLLITATPRTTMPSVDDIRTIIQSYPDPETGRPLGSMGQLHDVAVDGDRVSVSIGLTTHSLPIADEVRDAITSKIVAANPGSNVAIEFVDHRRPAPRAGQTGLTAKTVIAVGSGKGGVGKSTVAASLALTLQRLQIWPGRGRSQQNQRTTYRWLTE